MLQEERKKKGLSQRELAEKSGVNKRTIQKYEIHEKNINNASYRIIVALANALEIPIANILDEEMLISQAKMQEGFTRYEQYTTLVVER